MYIDTSRVCQTVSTLHVAPRTVGRIAATPLSRALTMIVPLSTTGVVEPPLPSHAYRQSTWPFKRYADDAVLRRSHDLSSVVECGRDW